ncbi:MAG: hypothetical protein P8P15_07900 [Polaribacter sp.]|nr:hypothetical protein [Polaribacter sp.]
MKKRILLLFFIISNTIYSQHSFSDTTKNNLKGKVKTLHESYFEVDNIYDETLDEDGYPDMKIVGFKRGKPKGTDDYIGFKYFYNKKGFITKQYQYSYGELFSKTMFLLNENNQKTELLEYKYVNGKFIERKKYYSHTYVYSKNQIIEKSINLETKKLYSRSVYVYNPGGKLDRFTTEYYKTGHKINQCYIYDSNNYLINIVSLPNEKKNREPTFVNNSKGDVIEAKKNKYIRGKMKKITEKYEYKYDNNDNWIEKITIVNKIPEIMTERKIEYY